MRTCPRPRWRTRCPRRTPCRPRRLPVGWTSTRRPDSNPPKRRGARPGSGPTSWSRRSGRACGGSSSRRPRSRSCSCSSRRAPGPCCSARSRDGLLVLVGLIPIVGADVVTEYRGERALEALRDASAPMARVRRNGTVAQVTAASLVPGDVVLLSGGDVVPADLRLFRVDRLQLDRSVLTGESIPEQGRTEPDAGDSDLADRRSIAYGGTSVVGGRGEGIVVAIGPATELGRISGGLDRSRSAAIAAPGRARPARPHPPVGRDRADRDRHVAGVHPGPGRGRDDPRRHLRRDRRDPRGAADPPRGRPRAGCLPPPQAGRARPPAERGGVPRRDRPDHHRQDRDADPQPARRGIGPDPGRPGRGRRRPVGDPARCAPRGGGRLGDRWRLAAQLVHPLADAGGGGGRAGGAPRSRRAPRCRAGLRCPSVRPHPGPP